MKPRVFAVLLGIAMVITGFVLGITQTSVEVSTSALSRGSTSTYACDPVLGGMGSASFVPLGANKLDVQDKCDEATGTKAVFVWLLIGLGVVVALGGMLIKPKTAAAPAPAPNAPAGGQPDGYTAEGQPYWLTKP